jgi:uracil permease
MRLTACTVGYGHAALDRRHSSRPRIHALHFLPVAYLKSIGIIYQPMNQNAIFIRTAKGNELLEADDQSNLPADHQRLLTLLDGSRSLSALQQQLGDELDINKPINELLDHGMIMPMADKALPATLFTLDYTYRLSFGQALLGAQMLFVAFGALVLVPLLTGLDPSVALLTAGVGTLIFQLVTGGRVPIFLASSFAFIAPIMYSVQTWGIPATLSGLMAAGVVYLLLSLLVALRGVNILHRLLPPIVTGPVILIIGLILAPVAVNMASGKTGDGAIQLIDPSIAALIAIVSLGVTVFAALMARGMLRIVPILAGITVGYLLSLAFGLVDFTPVIEAPWFAVPNFVHPEWSWAAILFILPVAIAPAIEHFGDMLAIRGVTGRDYLKNPGIHRTLLGDGLATSMAASLGGPPNTTYSEVTGAVALTKAFNPAIMTWAALTAIVLAFVGKLGALLQTIPVPVMGGVLIMLFGAIAVVGLRSTAKLGDAILEPRNLAIGSIIIVCGIGGLSIGTPEYSIAGIGLAGLLGVALNLILPYGPRVRD